MAPGGGGTTITVTVTIAFDITTASSIIILLNSIRTPMQSKHCHIIHVSTPIINPFPTAFLSA